MADLKWILKTLRATQPLNFVTTSVVPAVSGLGGGAPEGGPPSTPHGAVSVRLPNGRRLKLWSRADDWVSNQVFASDRPEVFCEVLERRGTGPVLEGILGPVGYRSYLLMDTGPQERTTIADDARILNYLFSPKALGEFAGTPSGVGG